jgi:hypothetical protein
MNRLKTFITLSILVLALSVFSKAQAEVLKPFILGSQVPGDMTEVVSHVTEKLSEQGFTVVGTYMPYPTATVICATHPGLLAAAAKTFNGGFGAIQRVAVTEVEGELQVAYVNPAYIGTAYGLGKLENISSALEDAMGSEQEYGAKGIKEEKLVPGKYHYKIMMPYFDDVHKLNTFTDHATAVKTVEENLDAGKGGTMKVYRIDIPEKEITVFGVAIPKGDGPKDRKDTDLEIMEIIDYKEIRSTPYLPYEIMVQGNEVIALHSRFRIAVHFPDTKMTGSHGFTAIMSSTKGIKVALEAVAGK